MNTVHQHLKQLNKNSHKITKPIRNPLPPDPNPPNLGQTQSHQPPVYTINKDDFRDVVQRLTGSPTPPPPLPLPLPQPPITTTHPRPLTSSRLQRIRPPPLFTSPPPPQNGVVSLSLPPLPSVHSAAESPISAYMRFLHSSSSSAPSPVSNLGQQAPQPASPISAYMRFLQNSVNTSMPQWNDVAPTPQQQQQQQTMSSAFPGVPLSPVPFGCAQSPRSLYGLLSPSQLFSPTGGGQLGFPLSPPPPVPSPR